MANEFKIRNGLKIDGGGASISGSVRVSDSLQLPSFTDEPLGMYVGEVYYNSVNKNIFAFDGVDWLAAVGSSGTSGTSGASGSSGTSGTSGASGSSGTSGTSGASGTSGTSGATGSSGTSGTSGINGTSGTSGINGSSGTSGVSGTSGTSGVSGTSGTSGTSGLSGTSGTSGINGSSGTSGTSGIDGMGVVPNTNISSITFIIDGGGEPATAGFKGVLEIPFACTINSWTLLADVAGSAVLDIWKTTYANYPPTSGNAITSTNSKPTLTSATRAQSSTLNGWTSSIAAGDVLGFNLETTSLIGRLVLSLKVTKV